VVEARGGLAFLVKRFPRLSETFVLNEFLELRRQGVAVDLFALMDPREPRAQPAAEALRPEVTYLWESSWLARFPLMARAMARHPAGALRAVRLLGRSVAAWRHFGEALILVDHLHRRGLGHIHAHFAHSPAEVAHLAHLVSGVPFSFTTHAKDLYTTAPEKVRTRAQAASFVATCTEANGRHLLQAIRVEAAKLLVARHGVDLSRFRAVRREPVPGRILSVGRLVPKKGFDVLVRGCAELDRMGVAFECVIFGDGPERANLEGLVNDLGLARTVRFFGARTQVELLAEYGRAAVFALACLVTADGDRDGLPNVLLEAMAAGVPVVSTAVSAIPELIVDRVNGRLVPPCDPDVLATALAGLLSNAEERRRLGAAGQARVCEEFALEARVSPLAAMFRGCVHEAELVET
jgi:glycosyltransferase involved in cell wall biosynthesis